MSKNKFAIGLFFLFIPVVFPAALVWDGLKSFSDLCRELARLFRLLPQAWKNATWF